MGRMRHRRRLVVDTSRTARAANHEETTVIDIATEIVLSLTEAATRLPRRKKGKKPHLATLYRWAKQGVKGCRLETIQIGGTLCTSMEAMQRFFNRMTSDDSATGAAPASAPPVQRQAQIEQAQRELTEEGI